jgi:hypothetical protein
VQLREEQILRLKVKLREIANQQEQLENAILSEVLENVE